MIEKRFYKQVTSYSSETNDYVIENGTLLRLYELGGGGALSNNIKVEIIWDPDGTPEIIMCTHETIVNQHTEKLLTGDGTKKLQIKLTNDTASSETIGAYWIGREY